MSDPFTSRLREGEQIIWTGSPSQGIRFRVLDLFLIPFSIMWGGISIFSEFGVVSSHAPGLFTLFGVPFVLMGLFMIFGRFLLDAWLRQGVQYALTNQRALIARRRGSNAFESIEIRGDVRLSNCEKDRKGTVSFGRPASLFGAGAGFSIWIPALASTPEFFLIEDASTVFDLIQRQSLR